jgi:hypothetical protein
VRAHFVRCPRCGDSFHHINPTKDWTFVLDGWWPNIFARACRNCGLALSQDSDDRSV